MRIPLLAIPVILLVVWLIASWLITTLGWTLIIALVLWGAIALAVARRAGRLDHLQGRFGQALDWLTNARPFQKSVAASSTPPQPATSPSSTRPRKAPQPPSVDPRQAGDIGVRRIDALYGLHGAKQQLDGLLDMAVAAKKKGQSGFGVRAPATMLVFQGPPGTGKTEMAIAFLHILYGAGIVPSDSFFKLESAHMVDQGAAGANMVSRQAAEAALDGVLIIENAEWMTGQPNRDDRFSIEVARGLMHVIERHPHRLVIIATGGDRLRDRLEASQALRRDLLNKIYIEDVAFDELSVDDLIRVFHDHGRAQQVHIARDMQARLPALIQTLRREEGDHFDNAHAVRRWFDRVYSRARRRAAHASSVELTAEDFRLETA